MGNLDNKQQPPSVAEQLQSVVNEILTTKGGHRLSRLRDAAEVLGMEMTAQQIVDERRQLEGKFAEAIQPILAILNNPATPQRKDLEAMNQVSRILDKLIKINGGLTGLEPITASAILDGCSRIIRGGVNEITIPVELAPYGEDWILVARNILNAAAEKRNITPVFSCDTLKAWREIERDPRYRTLPGVTYRFRVHISPDAGDKNRHEQEESYGKGAPVAALAVAEAALRLSSNAEKGVLQSPDDFNVYVRGSFPGAALQFNNGDGVGIYKVSDAYDDCIYYASLED